jgi:hypothetical protein
MTFKVTDEVVGLAYDIVEGWYPEGSIDWEDVWDRLDGSELEDGTTLDLGTDLLSPELKQLKRDVQKRRRESR